MAVVPDSSPKARDREREYTLVTQHFVTMTRCKECKLNYSDFVILQNQQIQQPRRCSPTTGPYSKYATNLCEYILHIRTVTVFTSDLISSWVWPLTSPCSRVICHISFTVMCFLLLSTTQALTEITFHIQNGDEMILTHTEGSGQQEDNTPYHLHTRHRRDFSQAKSVKLSLSLRWLIETDCVSHWTIRSSSD